MDVLVDGETQLMAMKISRGDKSGRYPGLSIMHRTVDERARRLECSRTDEQTSKQCERKSKFVDRDDDEV